MNLLQAHSRQDVSRPRSIANRLNDLLSLSIYNPRVLEDSWSYRLLAALAFRLHILRLIEDELRSLSRDGRMPVIIRLTSLQNPTFENMIVPDRHDLPCFLRNIAYKRPAAKIGTYQSAGIASHANIYFQCGALARNERHSDVPRQSTAGRSKKPEVMYTMTSLLLRGTYRCPRLPPHASFQNGIFLLPVWSPAACSHD